MGNWLFSHDFLQACKNGLQEMMCMFGNHFWCPVKPGDTLETSIWEGHQRYDKITDISFVMKIINTGKVQVPFWLIFSERLEYVA